MNLSGKKLDSFAEKLKESSGVIRVFEQRLFMHAICAVVFLLAALCIPFLFEDFLAYAVFFYPAALIGWVVYTVTTLKKTWKSLNEVVKKATDGEISYFTYLRMRMRGDLEKK